MNALKETIINLYYLIGSVKPIQYLFHYFQGKIAILMYHRVLPQQEALRDKTGNSISLEQFKEHMDYIACHYCPIAINEMEHALQKKDNKLYVVVTFDDGYKDVLYNALPVLKQYRIPVVVYITTRFLEEKCEMWWYELEHICKQKISVQYLLKGRKYYLSLKNEKEKTRGYKKLHNLLLYADLSTQKNVMSQLRAGDAPVYYNELSLNQEELKKLSKEPLITIGAHTHSHAILSRLNLDDVKQEMRISREILENNLSIAVKHFAYPYGGSAFAGKREYLAAKEAGFQTAVTTICGTIKNLNHIYALPRHTISRRHNIRRLSIKLSGLNAFFKLAI